MWHQDLSYFCVAFVLLYEEFMTSVEPYAYRVRFTKKRIVVKLCQCHGCLVLQARLDLPVLDERGDLPP